MIFEILNFVGGVILAIEWCWDYKNNVWFGENSYMSRILKRIKIFKREDFKDGCFF